MIYTSSQWLDGKIDIKRLTRTAQPKSKILTSSQKIRIVYLTNSNNGLSIGQEIVNHAIGGGKDPGLAYLDYEHYNSPQKKLFRTIQSKGIEATVRLFHELKKKSPEILD